jgi:hypothetical protein
MKFGNKLLILSGLLFGVLLVSPPTSAQYRPLPKLSDLNARAKSLNQSNYDSCVRDGEPENYCACVKDTLHDLVVREISTAGSRSGGRDELSQFEGEAQTICRSDPTSRIKLTSIFDEENESAIVSRISAIVGESCASSERAALNDKDKSDALDCACMVEKVTPLAWSKKKAPLKDVVGVYGSMSDLEQNLPYMVKSVYDRVEFEFDYKRSKGEWVENGSEEAAVANQCIYKNFTDTSRQSIPADLQDSSLYEACMSSGVAPDYFDCACVARDAESFRPDRPRKQVESALDGLERYKAYDHTPEASAARAQKIALYKAALQSGDFSNVGDVANVDDNTLLSDAYRTSDCFDQEKIKTKAQKDCVKRGEDASFCSCTADNYASSWKPGDNVRGRTISNHMTTARLACSR